MPRNLRQPDKVLYPTDEISAKRAPRLPVGVDGPANISRLDLDWVRAHDQALRATALAHFASRPTLIANRPVPRSASCHYLAIDKDHRNVYFY